MRKSTRLIDRNDTPNGNPIMIKTNLFMHVILYISVKEWVLWEDHFGWRKLKINGWTKKDN